MPASIPSLPVAVIGGGITGLTAAWHLKESGAPVVLYEASDRIGGAIGAERREGWLHELGPNSLLEGTSENAAFVDRLGLGLRRLYAAPAAKNRYVVRDGRLFAVPASGPEFFGTRLLSWRAKLALLGEPFRARATGGGDESVADFTRRRLGREFLDYLVDPFVTGIYAGDPRVLSLRYAFPAVHALQAEYGSLAWGVLRRRKKSGGAGRRILSFPDGLAELPQAMAAGLGDSIRRRSRVLTVRRAADGWEILSNAAGSVHPEKYKAVICAVSADALAALPFENAPGTERLSELKEIGHPAVASVFTGFRRKDVAHPLDGFGLLVPAVEKRGILGSLFSSTLFPGRAPAGHVAITTFVGGARQPEAARLAEPGLLDRVLRDLRDLLGVSGEPAFVNIHRWPRAIPQYALGFERFQAACAAAEAAAPGLFIGGNARDGISLASCMASGRRLAEAALASVPK